MKSEKKHSDSVVYCLKKIDNDSKLDIVNDSSAIRYSRMKLGIKTDIHYFADQLLTLTRKKIISHAEITEWVITAPPYNAIPAAANYLCWQIFCDLKKDPTLDCMINLVELSVSKESLKINDVADFKMFYDYSNNSVEQRIKERTKLHGNADDIINHSEKLKGRGVIVINDIKVTGTQQSFMQKSFNKVGVRCLGWLYIYELEKQLGLNEPQIENRLNATGVDTVDEYRELLCSTDINYTARCVSRLFTYDTPIFKSLLEALSHKNKLLMLDLVQREGRYSGDFFSEKYQVLKTICQQHQPNITVEVNSRYV